VYAAEKNRGLTLRLHFMLTAAWAIGALKTVAQCSHALSQCVAGAVYLAPVPRLSPTCAAGARAGLTCCVRCTPHTASPLAWMTIVATSPCLLPQR
jgi:pheromone shutdown protein TraB